MTEVQRHHLRGMARTLLISFGISIPMAILFAPKGVNPLLVALIFGLSFGMMIIGYGLLVPKLRHRSFIVSLLLQSVACLVGIVLVFSVALHTLIALTSRRSMFDTVVFGYTGEVLSSMPLLLGIGGSFLLFIVISSVYGISRKLGPGVLRNWVLGKYHEPREEERIFMFLDMKDSTTLAEKLGNLKFSALVRDFFEDLTKPVLETRGEVSHYIGDEAVLTWTMRRGTLSANCVRCYFLMEDSIAVRSEYYLRNYGLVPGFKAGVHCGPVVATEVGEIKSEIVFHGDVLNTAARIQGICGTLEEGLLISGELKALLPEADLLYLSHGRHLLKGKEMDVEIFGVSRRSTVLPEPELSQVPAPAVAGSPTQT